METSTFFNTLGKRVRILREDRELKQTELAQELTRYGVAIGSPQISKIEAGSALPSIEVLEGLERAAAHGTQNVRLYVDKCIKSAAAGASGADDRPRDYIPAEYADIIIGGHRSID